MKKTVIIIALAISLMSTKCAEKPLNIVFSNKSDKNIVFSSMKDTDSLKNIISEKSYHDSRFKYLKRNSIKTDTLIKSDLYFYSRKNSSFYTFYFFRVIKFDIITNSYVFEKRYDSINIDKAKISIGEEGNNTFIYSKSKIIFKSK
jgi:hypothetical protein